MPYPNPHFKITKWKGQPTIIYQNKGYRLLPIEKFHTTLVENWVPVVPAPSVSTRQIAAYQNYNTLEYYFFKKY